MLKAGYALFAIALFAALPGAASAQSAGQNPSFNLVNHASQPIRELYVTPAGNPNWGQNRLVDGPIASGGKLAVRLSVADKCVFDVQIVYADASKEEHREVNTCGAADFVANGAKALGKASDDPTFKLTNHLKLAIVELEATPGKEPRAANLLAAGPLIPDASITLHPTRGKGCSFELRVVLADKSVKTRTLDLCRVNELSIP